MRARARRAASSATSCAALAIESGFHVGGPTRHRGFNEYYETYGATRARLVESKTAAPWLGKRKRGFALESTAPPQLFSLPEGRRLEASGRCAAPTRCGRSISPVSLGALPLDLARPAIVTALQELARADRYEAWLLARERVLNEQAVCRRDAQPQVGVVELTDYLPFLAAD